jgi:hypothetical protein
MKAGDRLAVSDNDFAAYEIHARFAEASQRLEDAFNAFDFSGIAVVHTPSALPQTRRLGVRYHQEHGARGNKICHAPTDSVSWTHGTHASARD